MRITHLLLALACTTAGIAIAQTTAPATMPATAPASAPAAPLVVTGQMPDALKGKIADVVALIDNKKYIELLETLAPPEAVKKIKEGPDLPQFLERMETMGPKLRTALTTAASQNAEIGTNDLGQPTATFPKLDDNTPQLKFVFIDGNWTLK